MHPGLQTVEINAWFPVLGWDADIVCPGFLGSSIEQSGDASALQVEDRKRDRHGLGK